MGWWPALGMACAASCELEPRCQFAVFGHTEDLCLFGDLTQDASLAVPIDIPDKARLLYSLKGTF